MSSHPNMILVTRLTAAVATLTLAATTMGSFSIPRHLIAGGGGIASAGNWSVRSALAQPCTGVSAGVTASMVSGFFAGGLAPPPCPGDFNGDRLINTVDLVTFLARFGQVAPPGSPEALADFNADGAVNTADLVFFLGRFGTACPT